MTSTKAASPATATLSPRLLLIPRAAPKPTWNERLKEAGIEPMYLELVELVQEPHQTIQAPVVGAWIIFTSARAVEATDWRPAGFRICAVGPATAAAVQRAGHRVDFMPQEHSAEGVVNELVPQLPPGTHVVLPQSKLAHETLYQGLKEAGMRVSTTSTYSVKPASHLRENQTAYLASRGLGPDTRIVYVATSPSTVAAIADAVVPSCQEESYQSRLNRSAQYAGSRRPAPEPTPVIAIGPTTALSVMDWGMKLYGSAAEHSLDGVIDLAIAQRDEIWPPDRHA